MMNNNYRNDDRRRASFGPVPVKEGETYDVTIEGIGEKGDGIAKIQGFVIVVPKTQQGQRVKVRITAVRGKVSFAEVVGEGAPAEETGSDEDSSSDEDSGSDDMDEEEKE